MSRGKMTETYVFHLRSSLAALLRDIRCNQRFLINGRCTESFTRVLLAISGK